MPTMVAGHLIACSLFCYLVSSLASQIRYRARVAYDGSNFQGFQLQQGTNKRTVQSELEAVLSTRCNQPIRVVAAGRTDSGVHARGQAIHFDAENELDCQGVELSLRKMLPPDLVLWNLQQAPSHVVKELDNGSTKSFLWNVMYDSTHKLYSYRLSVAPVMHPIDRHRRWHPDLVHSWMDLTQLNNTIQHFVGTHDFRAFAGSVEQLEKKTEGEVNTVRTVYSATLIQESPENIRIDFKIKGALYKQIRNMVGTALDVCKGRITEQHLLRLLGGDATRTDNKSKPAPPQGLTLEHVYFDDF